MSQAMLPLPKGPRLGVHHQLRVGFGVDGIKGQTHYVAAKAGVAGMSRSLAREVVVTGSPSTSSPLTQAVRDRFPPALLEAPRETRAAPR